ncbi:MAG: tetratricopeptide repeat protein [Myxococcota bacterium]
MDVRCDKCGTEYEFDDARVGEGGVTVKCTNCSFVFRVKRPDAPRRGASAISAGGSQGSGPAKAQEWLVKKPDGQMIAFRELTTLQKWIVEGRIGRDDEISRNQETWKRLGNINELEPFFSVFERAKALNELMATGAIGDRPVIVNGSEVLATMSPLSSIVAASSPLPDRGPMLEDLSRPPPLRPSDGPRADARRSSVVTRAQPIRSDRTRGPSMITRRGDLVGFEPSIDPGPPPPIADRELDTEPPPPKRSTPAPTPIVTTREVRPAPAPGLGLGLERTTPPPPRARTVAELGLGTPISLDASVPPSRRKSSVRGDEIVAHFERQRRRRRAALGLGIFVALGLGGGAGFAMFGPDQNPIRNFAERYGILPPGSHTRAPQQNAALDAARRALELDTLTDLAEADRVLSDAVARQNDDLDLRAELGLVLSTRADALRRSATRKDARAQKLEQEGAATQAEQKTLKDEAAQERITASQLVKRAFELIRVAYEKEPDALGPSRALADYYRVQRDESGRMKQVLAQAKAAATAANTTDAATLFIEAADIAKDLSKAAPADLERATRLLEEALTVRPTLNRARVLLARILVVKNQPDLASAELQKVLEAAPKHEEAKELLESLAQKSGPSASPSPSETPAASAAPSPSETAAPSQAPTQIASAAPTPSAAPSPVVTAAPPTPKATPSATPQPSVTGVPPSAGPSAAPVKGGFDGYMKQADRLRERGQAWEALLSYEKGADLKPSSGRAYAGMGWCYLDLGKPEAALHQFRKSIAVEPTYAEGHLGHAEAYRALGNTEKALSSYKRYLELRPEGVGAETAKRAIAAIEGGNG